VVPGSAELLAVGEELCNSFLSKPLRSVEETKCALRAEGNFGKAFPPYAESKKCGKERHWPWAAHCGVQGDFGKAVPPYAESKKSGKEPQPWLKNDSEPEIKREPSSKQGQQQQQTQGGGTKHVCPKVRQFERPALLGPAPLLTQPPLPPPAPAVAGVGGRTPAGGTKGEDCNEWVEDRCQREEERQRQRHRERAEEGQAAAEEAHEPITTLMICDLPCSITQPLLCEAIDTLGFARKYDLLHLPAAGRSMLACASNLGYGFINFREPQDAVLFAQAFDGYKFDSTGSTKVCKVRQARVQGVVNTLKHCRQKSGKRCSRGSFMVSL